MRGRGESEEDKEENGEKERIEGIDWNGMHMISALRHKLDPHRIETACNAEIGKASKC